MVFCHALMIADIDNNKMRKVVRRTHIERCKINSLKDETIKKSFDEKVIELVDVGVTNW